MYYRFIPVVPLAVSGLLACGGGASTHPFSSVASTAGTGGGMAGTNSGAGGTLDALAVGVGGAGSGAGGMPFCGTELTGRVRDFKVSHPDFESFLIGPDLGMVEKTLGGDKKPVYTGKPLTFTTSGKANFDQWYRDVPTINLPIPLTLKLVDQGNGISGYDNQAFFPIDKQGFGNEGNSHNFHFTFELHTSFVYKGFEIFQFNGDDDLWVFVNNKLAIDLGGVHPSLEGKVDMLARSAELGLVVGNVYALDLFFAERHTSESHFKVQTTIGSFTDCGTDVPQ